MVNFIIGLICLIVTVGVILLRNVYFAIPKYELKRKAINGDNFAQKVYPLIAHGAIVRGFLWFLLVVFSALSIVLFNQFAPFWLAIILVILWLWLVFSWLPNRPPSNFSKIFALSMIPIVSEAINLIYPIVKKVEDRAGYYPIAHSGIYEVDDLRYLLARQLTQSDNRIDPKDIQRLERMLIINKVKVKEHTIPLANLLLLNGDDLIGPKLLDELYRSTQTCFLVSSSKSSHRLIGVLNKQDVGLSTQGKVRDFIHNSIIFINANDSMEKALTTFALHSCCLLAVTNQDKELIGTISLSDSLDFLFSRNSLKSTKSKDLAENDNQLVIKNISQEN